MDATTLRLLGGLLSAVLQMTATLVVLFCVVSFFSYKPGGSTRFFYISVGYFLSLHIVLFAASVAFESTMASFPVFSNVSNLLMASLIHLIYGILIIVLYVRTVVFE